MGGLLLSIGACMVPMGVAPIPEARIPQFPWPPPYPSAELVLPTGGLINVQTSSLSTFDKRLNEALDAAGYGDRRYYAVPSGFALVTRVKQTEQDGTPKKPPGRWLLGQPDPTAFSLARIVADFVNAPSGYYQMLVFIVTNVPFNSNADNGVTWHEAGGLLANGLNVLPDSVGNTRWTPDTHCTVLVYEFVKPPAGEATDSTPIFRQDGRMSAKDHLVKASVWAALGEKR